MNKEIKTNAKIREESGHVSYPSDDWLTSLLYGLMRDAAPIGMVEKVVRDLEEETIEEIVYTNGWLAKYAKHLADRIREAKKDVT